MKHTNKQKEMKNVYYLYMKMSGYKCLTFWNAILFSSKRSYARDRIEY